MPAPEAAEPASGPAILPSDGTPPPQAMPAAAEPQTMAAAGVTERANPASLRRLERELAEVQDEVGALQEMLEELPAILERKFRGRLDKLLAQQRLLEADNHGLRRRLQALLPGVDLETQALRPRALLPPSIRTALRLRTGSGEESGGSSPDADQT